MSSFKIKKLAVLYLSGLEHKGIMKDQGIQLIDTDLSGRCVSMEILAQDPSIQTPPDHWKKYNLNPSEKYSYKAWDFPGI